MREKLIGLFEHHYQNLLQPFTMTDEHENGAFHIFETLQKFIIDLEFQKCLAHMLFIQIDSWTWHK